MNGKIFFPKFLEGEPLPEGYYEPVDPFNFGKLDSLYTTVLSEISSKRCLGHNPIPAIMFIF